LRFGKNTWGNMIASSIAFRYKTSVVKFDRETLVITSYTIASKGDCISQFIVVVNRGSVIIDLNQHLSMFQYINNNKYPTFFATGATKSSSELSADTCCQVSYVTADVINGVTPMIPAGQARTVRSRFSCRRKT